MLDKKYIDPALTPKNAEAKGYKYMGEVIDGPTSSLQELLELLEAKSFKLGKPVNRYQNEPDYYGLYWPLENTPPVTKPT